MSNNEPSRESIDRRPASEKLNDVLHNPDFIEYALGEGPLTLDKLPLHVRDSSEVTRVATAINWPDEASTQGIEPVYAIPPEEVASLIYERREPHMNNFLEYLRYPAAGIDDAGKRNTKPENFINTTYGAAPFAVRANTIAPELFDALRQALVDIPRFDKEAFVADPHLAEGVLMAYSMMGRLIRKDDLATQLKIMGIKVSEEATPGEITDAHATLTQ